MKLFVMRPLNPHPKLNGGWIIAENIEDALRMITAELNRLWGPNAEMPVLKIGERYGDTSKPAIGIMMHEAERAHSEAYLN